MSGEVTLKVGSEDRFDRFRRIRWWDQERVGGARVLVVGAGALGNEILKNLALLGVGAVFVIDKDTIETSNLPRSVLFRQRDRGAQKSETAAAAARDIFPGLRVRPCSGDVLYDLGLGVFAWADVVIGGLDSREARLHVSRACWKTGTPFVDGATEILQGVVRVFQPPTGPCYECTLTEQDWQALAERRGCGGLRPDDAYDRPVPTTPTTASIVAALQCQEALKLLHGLDALHGSGVVFNGLTLDWYTTRYTEDPNCNGHERFDRVVALETGSHSMSLGDLMRDVGSHLGEGFTIDLEREILTRFYCPECDRAASVFRPVGRVRESEARCDLCAAMRQAETISSVPRDTAHGDRPLSEFGIAPYDIVAARVGQVSTGFLLDGDARSVLCDLAEPQPEGRGAP